LTAFDHVTISSTAVYLVKGIIPRSGITVVWGPPKCGKSFWTFHVAMHVALGWEYQGRRVHGGPVVYLALEGGEGFKARIEAFRQRCLSEQASDIPFYLISASVNFVKDRAALVESIKNQLDKMPVLVVIDTLNRSLAGSESDDKDMAAYIRAADAIREALGCAVVIVHHCGVDGTRPRGHTSPAGIEPYPARGPGSHLRPMAPVRLRPRDQHGRGPRQAASLQACNRVPDRRPTRWRLGRTSVDNLGEDEMGMRRDAKIAGWQKAYGIKPPTGDEAHILRRMSDAAFELIKVIQLELSGIRDGDGYWSGSDAMGGTAQNLVDVINEFERCRSRMLPKDADITDIALSAHIGPGWRANDDDLPF
jgi:hypothetical protein